MIGRLRSYRVTHREVIPESIHVTEREFGTPHFCSVGVDR